jgi:hypothetical protein
VVPSGVVARGVVPRSPRLRRRVESDGDDEEEEEEKGAVNVAVVRTGVSGGVKVSGKSSILRRKAQVLSREGTGNEAGVQKKQRMVGDPAKPCEAASVSEEGVASPPTDVGTITVHLLYGFVGQEWRGAGYITLRSALASPTICMAVLEGALPGGFDYLEVMQEWSASCVQPSVPAVRIWEKRNTPPFHGDGTNLLLTKILERRLDTVAGNFGILGDTHIQFNDYLIGTGREESPHTSLFAGFHACRQLLRYFHPKTGKLLRATYM